MIDISKEDGVFMIFYTILACVLINFIVSLVFFIKDGHDARIAGRKRSANYSTLFMVSAGVLGITILLILAVILLVNAFMASM